MARLEAKEGEALREMLERGDHSELKQALRGAHSRNVFLQVREVRLARALEAATSAEAAMRRESDEVVEDASASQRAAAERQAFHERRAAEAELRATRAQRELDLCIPRAEHAAVADAHRALQLRFKVRRCRLTSG